MKTEILFGVPFYLLLGAIFITIAVVSVSHGKKLCAKSQSYKSFLLSPVSILGLGLGLLCFLPYAAPELRVLVFAPLVFSLILLLLIHLGVWLKLSPAPLCKSAAFASGIALSNAALGTISIGFILYLLAKKLMF